jgi:O-antigen/teichoic acid export membrane protein
VSDGIDPTVSIGSRIRSGLAWKAGSQVTLQISRMVIALVLARLLAPHDWGLAAMVVLLSGFVVVFTDSALGTALIQRRDLREEDRSTIFWMNTAIGVLLAVVGIGLAGPLASFYGEAEVEPLFAVLSIGFFVTALGSTHAALLVREMRFNLLELRLIAATVVGATTGVSLAVADYGAWAIVGQQLAEAVTSTLLLWYLSPWHPTATFSRSSMRSLGGFAGTVFAENLLYQAGRNVGGLLIGRFLGPASVGAFVLANNVILVPFSRMAGPLQQVFFPAFSQMSDDKERMASVWIRATRLVGLISIPALVGLVIVAPDFVEVVLGSRWRDATPLIQILAVAGLIQSLQTLSGEVLLALGRASTLLRFTMLWFVANVGAFALGLQWGIIGVAVCSVAATVLVEPVRTHLTARALGIPMSRFVAALSGISQAAALMAAAVLAGRAGLVALDVPAAARLVLLVVVGAVAYGAGCLWRAPEISRELRTAISGRRATAVPAVEPLKSRV